MPQRFEPLLDPALIHSGLFPSLDEAQVPLWIGGSNVDFREGQVRKARGYSAFLTAGANVNALAQALVSGTKRLFIGTATALYKYDDAGSITSLRTGLSSGRWSLLPWGYFLIASNDVDQLQYYQNTGSAASITDGPSHARIVRALNVFVVAFDAGGTPGRFAWSDRGNPAVWTPTAENLAGGDNIRNIASRTQAAEEFLNGIAVWSTERMYLVSFVGGTAIIAYRTLDAGCGAAGMNCVVIDGPLAYGVEPRGFWRTDGVQVQWSGKPAIWDTVKSRIDFSQGDAIIGYRDPSQSLVGWYYPVVGGGYEGWTYNTENGAWAPRDYRIDAACDDKVWGRPIGANQAAIYKLGDTVNKAGVAMSSYVQSKPLAFGETDRYKWLDELRLRMTNTSGGQLVVGLGETPDAVDEWLTAETLVERHAPLREAAFWTLKFQSTALDADWSFAGVEPFGEWGGSRL